MHEVDDVVTRMPGRRQGIGDQAVCRWDVRMRAKRQVRLGEGREFK